jgi:hypothetical protein
VLPNEAFALRCRTLYKSIGLVVDATNGEFAHSPYPKDMCDTGHYLLHDHHQHHGILQSKDVGQCCFFVGHAKNWLLTCEVFPDNYFELWDIYEEYSSLLAIAAANKAHEEKDKKGRSLIGVEAAERLHEEKDEDGKSKRAVEWGKKGNKEGKRRSGKTVSSQVWESMKDGFRGSAANVVRHNKANGWDPNARRKLNEVKVERMVELIRISDREVFIFETVKFAAETLGLNLSNLHSVCREKQKTIKGYTARYFP